LNIFIRFGDIRRRTSKSSEIGPNFACFSPPKFVRGTPSKILDLHYKIRPSTDHRAKFHAGQPTHLGDLMLGKKLKIIMRKTEVLPKTIVFGRTNNESQDE